MSLQQPIMHLALWEPEIPPNTGNVARLCAATGTRLHLAGRLGFHLDDRSLRRAGCDYWSAVDLRVHATLADLERELAGCRIIVIESSAPRPYTRAEFRAGDCLLFGPESRGLPPGVLARHAADSFHIPMPAGKVRSLNLANAAAIVLYEA